jgi:hypothetical protein
MDATNVAVTSENGQVTLTLALNGRITDLRFDNELHRLQSGAELAAVLIEVLGDARSAAAAAAAELLGPASAPDYANSTVRGDPFGDLLADLDGAFRSDLRRRPPERR